MHVILEGADNSGKTTLARTIENGAIGLARYWHAGGPPRTREDELTCLIQQSGMVLETCQYIMDRVTAISQQVYNPDPTLEASRKARLQLLAKARGVIIVYCRPSTDRLLRAQDLTWREEEDDAHRQKIINNLHVFVERYDQVMQQVPCIQYDYETSESTVLRTKLISALRGDVAALNWLTTVANLNKPKGS